MLDKNYEKLQGDLITDENGEILIQNVLPGTYNIRQTQIIEGYSLMNYITNVKIKAEDRITNVKIINYKKNAEQVIENNEKEINVEEEQNVIKEINNKEILNIYNNNTSKEVTDSISENNYYYNRDFISNIGIKKVNNAQNNDIYDNVKRQNYTQQSYFNKLEDNNAQNIEDWINYIELKSSGTSLLKLPKAGI